MPLQSLQDYNTPGNKRFLLGLVGQGPALGAIVRVLEREDFVKAFPRVKVAGWVPPASGGDDAAVPAALQSQHTFADVQSMFAARPGIDLALDLSPDARHMAELRRHAPPQTTLAAASSILRFCQAAEDGKLAIGGGESLRKAHSLFALLVDQMDDDVLIMDRNGVILDINRHAAESRGVPRSSVIGRHCRELDASFPCCDEEQSCPYNEARETGKKADHIFTQVMPNGKVRYLHTFCFPLADPFGDPMQFLFIRRDVTDQQHLEQRLQQNEKMAAIGELSTYMAHEIRNPLFSIGGFANALLRNTSLDENAREKARIIFDEARRLDVILTSILNFARPTEQTMGIFEPETVARQTMDLMTLGGEERGIHAHTIIAPNLPKVRGNAENLKQCLINLVKNSMEAVNAGGHVTMRLARSNGQVVIDVEDTGPGIPPELHDQVFSPFYTTKKGGAGLGLAMTRKVIEEMGGKVLLSSQQGQGTRVTLMLPAALNIDEGN